MNQINFLFAVLILFPGASLKKLFFKVEPQKKSLCELFLQEAFEEKIFVYYSQL